MSGRGGGDPACHTNDIGHETIRPAVQADVPRLHALVEAAYRGESARSGWTHEADLLTGQRTDPASLAELIGTAGSVILLGEVHERLIGCVHVQAQAGARAYLGLLSVRPDMQAGGLGRRLIAAAEHHAQHLFGARTMEMTVIWQRAELIAYYERRGYRQTGEQRPFPLDDPRCGIPITRDLAFIVLSKPIGSADPSA